MLSSEISLALAGGKSAREIASEIAQTLMTDPGLLKSELQGGGPLSRKRFCEFFGIGESTLTGWLQADRIPQAAALGYVLLLAARKLQEQVSKLETQQSEPRVFAQGNKYAVVRFETADDGEIIGRVVASEITELAVARQIAFGQSSDMLGLVGRQLEFVGDLIEANVSGGTDTPLLMDELNSERAALQRLRLLMTDYERWAKPQTEVVPLVRTEFPLR